MNYYKKKIDEIYIETGSSIKGLKNSQVKEKLQKDGFNKLVEGKQKSNFTKFLEQFKNLMVIILIIAAIISFITAYIEGESLVEGAIILVIVILNAIFGYVQEAKADKAISELKKYSVAEARVKRDGKVVMIPSIDIVTGDIILLEAGDTILADARVIESISLKVEEASLTGESGSVSKNELLIKEDKVLSERKNMVYSSSNVVYGKGTCIVVGTGMNTEIGKIATSLSTEEKTETPLQKKINNISKILSIIVLFIVLIMMIIGIIRGNDLMHIFIIAISLAVAAIPEGLPAVITIILSLGMTRLAKKNAVVRKISSVETLGSTEIICSDKTGTITKNQMTVREIFFNNKFFKTCTNELVNKIMLLCNNVVKEDKYIGDPTEIALYQFVENHKDFKKYKETKRIFEFPFDSIRKLMTTIYEDNEFYAYTKGSTEYLLSICKYVDLNGDIVLLTEDLKENIKKMEMKMADKALRVLGLAYKKVENSKKYKINEVEKDLIFIGMVGMIDPPREDVKESIEACYKSGIKPIMITGDSLNTAIAIAKEVGIYKKGDVALSGLDLDKISDDELYDKIHSYSVFARVTPEHKLRIVKAWQKHKKIVAMTGDGVNDAPAIKVSDVGVGMGITGTEVSKSVSDIVLLDDSFSTIVDAVEEGRNIYENIRKAISYLLTANIAEVIIVFIAMLFGVDIFLPIHLLYINLVTDSLPAIALSFESNDKDIMNKPARKNSSSIFTNFLIAKISFSSVLKAVSILVIYFITVTYIDPNKGSTIAFLALIMFEMFYALSSRNLYKTVINKRFFENKYMNYSMLFLTALQIIIFITPLSSFFEIVSITMYDFLFIFTFVILMFLVDELLKPIIYRRFKD